MKAPITFAIAGFGDRGSTYASMQKLFPDRMKVVAVADINPEKVQKAKELYGIKDELCFTSAASGHHTGKWRSQKSQSVLCAVFAAIYRTF